MGTRKPRDGIVPRTGDTQFFLYDPDGVDVELNFPKPQVAVTFEGPGSLGPLPTIPTRVRIVFQKAQRPTMFTDSVSNRPVPEEAISPPSLGHEAASVSSILREE